MQWIGAERKILSTQSPALESNFPIFNMALTGVGVRTTLIFPCVISSARFRLVRSISKMAASCKAGRNKRREVKVG